MARKLISSALLILAVASLASAREPRVLRSRILEARPQALRATRTPGDSMPLRLFSDASYEAVLEDLKENRRNGLVWRGYLVDQPYSWLVMVEHKGAMAGVISTGDRIFRVRFAGLGLHVVEEMDPLSIRWRGDDAVVPDLTSSIPLPADQFQTSATGDTDSTAIDVLMVYTNKAARVLVKNKTKYWWVRETDKKRAIKTQAMLSIAVANAALENSRIKAHFRLIGIKKVKGRGSGDFADDLDRLRDPADDYMDNVHALRSQLGADFVVLILGKFDKDAAGMGYVVPATHPSSPDHAFSVVRSSYLWWTTVAHEIGHNMGLVHNPEDDNSPASHRSHPFARGYRNKAAGLATVMAYTTGCDDCWLSIPHFSNPRVKWKGTSRPSDPAILQPKCRGDESPQHPEILFPVCGIATGTSDFNSARSIKKSLKVFEAFRTCQVDCQPTP